MLKKSALLVSIILHPLFMPLAGMSILLFTGSYISLFPVTARKMILFLIATGTLVLPAVMMPLAYFRNEILMQRKNDRSLPLAFTFIFYILTYFLFLKIPVYRFMHNFMLGVLLSVFLALIINLKWKISLHMIGLGGLSSFLLITSITHQINFLPWLIIVVFASGIAGSARLYLKAHSPAQVYTGFLVGCLAMSVGLLIPGN